MKAEQKSCYTVWNYLFEVVASGGCLGTTFFNFSIFSSAKGYVFRGNNHLLLSSGCRWEH